MMQAATSSGGGYSAASAIHINMFGPHAIVVHGTPEQKERWLKPLIRGEQKACFGVTEPDAGLDTTSLKTFATPVPGGYRVKGRKMWTSTGQVAHKILLLTRTTAKKDCKKPDRRHDAVLHRPRPHQGGGAAHPQDGPQRGRLERRVHRRPVRPSGGTGVGEEGQGFKYILDSLNPERILVASEAIGVGRDALRRASQYARDRVVFGRPIGQNQGIQHPLAECWTYLESVVLDGAARRLALRQRPVLRGPRRTTAKFLSGRACFNTATQAVLTLGGMGYAREYQVGAALPRVDPNPDRPDHRTTRALLPGRASARNAQVVLGSLWGRANVGRAVRCQAGSRRRGVVKAPLA